MKNEIFHLTARRICFLMISGVVNLDPFNAHAETVYYSLNNVIMSENNEPMTGIFSWTFTNDFEKGEGQFISLQIPWTIHDESDLVANIDATESIEITLEGSVHDDGVDIMLVLLQPLTPTSSSPINLTNTVSKYEIGGNGFHTGYFISGSITLTNLTLSITPDSPGSVALSWEPEIPGSMLQEKPILSTNWMDSVSGTTNPVVIPITAPVMFYRVVQP